MEVLKGVLILKGEMSKNKFQYDVECIGGSLTIKNDNEMFSFVQTNFAEKSEILRSIASLEDELALKKAALEELSKPKTNGNIVKVRICGQCGEKVKKNSKDGGDYPYECKSCNQSLYGFETEIVFRPKKINKTKE